MNIPLETWWKLGVCVEEVLLVLTIMGKVWPPDSLSHDWCVVAAHKPGSRIVPAEKPRMRCKCWVKHQKSLRNNVPHARSCDIMERSSVYSLAPFSFPFLPPPFLLAFPFFLLSPSFLPSPSPFLTSFILGHEPANMSLYLSETWFIPLWSFAWLSLH